MSNIKIVPRTSKLWELWGFWFPASDISKVYIPFGKIIFTPPNSIGISGDLLTHESVHLDQQNNGYFFALLWHIEYRLSKKFRLEQEVEAYRAQLVFLREKLSYNAFFDTRRKIAAILSSPMYGNMISYSEAYKRLSQETD